MPRLFTSQTARLAGRLSAAKRQRQRNEQGNAGAAPKMDAETRQELAIVNKQIKRTCETLDDETPYCEHCERPALEPHHRAQLLRALDGLLERRRKLTGRFAPGTMRPQDSPKDKRQAPPSFHVIPHGDIPETTGETTEPTPGISTDDVPGETPGSPGLV